MPVNSVRDLDDRMVFAVLGGSIAGASLSQLLFGRVNSLPIAFGMVGGYLFYGASSQSVKNRGVGASYSN